MNEDQNKMPKLTPWAQQAYAEYVAAKARAEQHERALVRMHQKAALYLELAVRRL